MSERCRCGHDVGEHIGAEICIAQDCECAQFVREKSRAKYGMGGDATTQRPLSIDAPTSDDNALTIGDRLAALPATQDEAPAELAPDVVERAREAYAQQRGLPQDDDGEFWSEFQCYFAWAEGMKPSEIAARGTRTLAFVYVAIRRVSTWLAGLSGTTFVPLNKREQKPGTAQRNAAIAHAVTKQGMTTAGAARKFGVSRTTVHLAVIKEVGYTHGSAYHAWATRFAKYGPSGRRQAEETA